MKSVKLLKDKYKKSVIKKQKGEAEILAKYVDYFKSGLDNYVDNQVGKTQLKHFVEIKLPEDNFVYENLKNNPLSIKYNGELLLTTYKNERPKGAKLEQNSIPEYGVRIFFNAIQEEIPYLNFEELNGILEIDLCVNGLYYNMLLINDHSSNGKTFIITSGFDFEPSGLELICDNSVLLKEKKKQLSKFIDSNKYINIICAKDKSDLILNKLFDEGSVMFYNDISNASILSNDDFRIKDIFEYKRNITTDFKMFLNGIKDTNFDMYVFFYPTSHELELLNKMFLDFSKVIIFTSTDISGFKNITINENLQFENENGLVSIELGGN